MRMCDPMGSHLVANIASTEERCELFLKPVDFLSFFSHFLVNFETFDDIINEKIREMK